MLANELKINTFLEVGCICLSLTFLTVMYCADQPPMSLQRSFPFFYLKGLFKLTKEDYGQGGLVYKDMAVLSKNKKLL